MGSYKEVTGNLLDMFDSDKFEVIAHGANCCCIMSAGIAKQIKDRYPGAYYADLYDVRSTDSGDPGMTKLGSLSWHEIDNWKYIINLYTQFQPGPNADLTAIRMSLKQLSFLFSGCNSIGLPLIGCGIGGLKWDNVKIIIQEELKDFDVTVVHFKEK